MGAVSCGSAWIRKPCDWAASMDDCCRRMHRRLHSPDECTVRGPCLRISLRSSTLCFLHRAELAVSLARLFVVFALLPAQAVPRWCFSAVHGDQAASICRFLDGASSG